MDTWKQGSRQVFTDRRSFNTLSKSYFSSKKDMAFNKRGEAKKILFGIHTITRPTIKYMTVIITY